MRLLASSLLAVALLWPSSVRSAVQARKDSCHVKERVEVPRGWVKRSPAPADHVIQLRVGLPQPNFAALEKHLYQVSDPYHQRYGQHLSRDEVEALVAPNTTSIELVHAWLAHHGFSGRDIDWSPAKDWATIHVPVHLAEKMLGTKYHIWKQVDSGDSVIRTTTYCLPKHLLDHVDVIQPTTAFSLFKSYKSTIHGAKSLSGTLPPTSDLGGGTIDPSCNTTITLNCLRQLYGAVGYKPSATNGNQMGLTGFLDQFANLADLKQFYELQNPNAVNSTFTVISVNGGTNSQNASQAGAEANLDTQYALGLTDPTPGFFYTTAGSPPFLQDQRTPNNTNEPYLSWLSAVLKEDNPPQTISTSYGDDEQTVPESYARRACQEFAQLGVRGVSLLFSSGDGGVGDGNPNSTTQTCFTNDGRNLTQFIPVFPAGCPYVTTVGATVQIEPEVAASFSGGGFSKYFARPGYQHKAVESFLDKLPNGTYDGLFNRKGRAFPDVSAQGVNFAVVIQGNVHLIFGTSASSPTFAAIISLLNDARLSRGSRPLGFLNLWLYNRGLRGLNDITAGNNPGCGTPGFNATEGWDPVTGLGTPNFAALLDTMIYP